MVVLNLVLITFNFWPGGKGPENERRRPFREPMPEKVARILNFSQEQKETYRKMGRKHHEQVIALRKKKDEAVIKFLEASTRDSVDISLDTKMEEILEIEREKILLTYQHLEDIKNLCNDEQLKNFSEVINVMFKTPAGGRRPGGPPGPPHRQRPPEN